MRSGNKTSFKMMGSSPVKASIIPKAVKSVKKIVNFTKKFFNKPKNETIKGALPDPKGDFIRKSLKKQLSEPVETIKYPYVTKHPQTGKEIIQNYGRKDQITIK